MPNTSLPFDFGESFVSRPQIIQELDRYYGVQNKWHDNVIAARASIGPLKAP